MSLIENLLRGHRRRCEEQRRALAELEELAQRLRADARRLREAIDDDAFDQHFAGQAVLRHATVERSIAAIETQIGAAAAALLVAEAELRKSERAVARHDGAGQPAEMRSRRRGRRKHPAPQPGVGPERCG